LTLLGILIRFPVRGEEPAEDSPQGQQPKIWSPWIFWKPPRQMQTLEAVQGN